MQSKGERRNAKIERGESNSKSGSEVCRFVSFNG